MSEARVLFHDAAGDAAMPGHEVTFSFRCPRDGGRCGRLYIAGCTDHKRDANNRNGGIAQWNWDGSRETPTFMPSINCVGCWHGYIRGGRCVNTGWAEEPEPKRKDES